jgi:hypothetical protein
MSLRSKLLGNNNLRNVIDVLLVAGGIVFVLAGTLSGWSGAEWRANMAIAAVVLMFAANVPYMLNAVFGDGRPVFVTWLLLGIITLLVVRRDMQDGVSFAALYPLFGAGVMNVMNCLAGIRKASFRPTKWDVLCALVVVLAIVKWQTSDDALMTVVYLTIASVVAYLPTWLSAWSHPEHETFRTYPRNTVRYALITGAVYPYTLATVLYSGTWIAVNGLFALYLLWRKAAVQTRKEALPQCTLAVSELSDGR